MKLIDKDALVAEIEKLMNRYDSEYDEDSTEVKAAKGNVCHEILCAINSLEVKEVDLDKPFEDIKVQTSMESGSLDEVIVTTKYKAQKGEKV